MGFASKVTFVYKNKTYLGMICQENEDGTFDVLTTGEDGQLWTLKRSQLKLYVPEA